MHLPRVDDVHQRVVHVSHFVHIPIVLVDAGGDILVVSLHRGIQSNRLARNLVSLQHHQYHAGRESHAVRARQQVLHLHLRALVVLAHHTQCRAVGHTRLLLHVGELALGEQLNHLAFGLVDLGRVTYHQHVADVCWL